MRRNPFMPKSRLLAFVIKELREILPPTVFFAVSFYLIVLTTDLILADYRASFGSFMVATMAALVVGKAVLVARGSLFSMWFGNERCCRFEAIMFLSSLQEGRAPSDALPRGPGICVDMR
jgi:hypothetical protein